MAGAPCSRPPPASAEGAFPANFVRPAAQVPNKFPAQSNPTSAGAGGVVVPGHVMASDSVSFTAGAHLMTAAAVPTIVTEPAQSNLASGNAGPALGSPPEGATASLPSYAQLLRQLKESSFVHSHAEAVASFGAVPDIKIKVEPRTGTKEGFPAIFFSPADVARAEEAVCLNAVVVKFSSGRPSLEDCHAIISTQWALKGLFTMGLLDKRTLLLRFQFESDVVLALTRNSNHINSFPFKIYRWNKCYNSREDASIAPGEPDCPFYLKTGSCKYGATCRYNHPDRTSINPPLVGDIGQTIMPSSATSLPAGLINPAANLIPSMDPLLAQASLGVGPTVYPQRPGKLECDFYMKTGQCKFGERCRFHHPIDRSAPNAPVAQVQPNVKLTLAGLPRREGSVACAFYMKTGTCKYGVACKFDHPPPGEAVALATAQGTGVTGAEAEEY